MSYLISQIIPAIKTLKIVGNTGKFEAWLDKNHPQKSKSDLFEGYRFALNCCLNTFVDGISDDSELEIENDFLFIRANSDLKPVYILPNSCEKIILLKNIKSTVKNILKAKSYQDISKPIEEFNILIASRFEQIWNDCISVSDEINIEKSKIFELLLIDFAHTYLMQIKNNGPVANTPNPLAIEWTKEEKKKEYLEGYKYAVQFLWSELLGELEINKMHLSKLHEADSWRTYNYIENNDDPFGFSNYFNLDEQTNFDSYFYWVQNEITDPLGKSYNVPIYSINNYLKFSPVNYNKTKVFVDLLDNSRLKDDRGLNWHQKIRECLYWYPYELIDSEKSALFFGISSFNTMLAGTVALNNPKKGGFSKTIIARFTHPLIDDKQKKDYSYAILIDTASAAGHHSNGWVIYQNACGDYSGFSGSEYRITEKLIAKYKKQNKIELRELNIPLAEFIDFTNQQVLKPEELSILKINKLIPDIIQKSRAYLLELFTYQVCNRYYGKDYHVVLGEGKKTTSGEKDVVISTDDEVILIECKLNPNSYEMEKIVAKMEKKIQDYNQEIKSVQFWFWEELSSQNKAKLDQLKIENKPIEIITLSKPSPEKFLKGVSFDLMNFIMQDYTS